MNNPDKPIARRFQRVPCRACAGLGFYMQLPLFDRPMYVTCSLCNGKGTLVRLVPSEQTTDQRTST